MNMFLAAVIVVAGVIAFLGGLRSLRSLAKDLAKRPLLTDNGDIFFVITRSVLVLFLSIVFIIAGAVLVGLVLYNILYLNLGGTNPDAGPFFGVIQSAGGCALLVWSLRLFLDYVYEAYGKAKAAQAAEAEAKAAETQ